MMIWISLIVLAVIIYLLTYGIKAKSKVTNTRGYNYVIRFKNIDKKLDLSENEQLKDKIKIISSTDDIYTVTALINDAKLKEILMADYGLKAGQVIVQPARGFSPLSAI